MPVARYLRSGAARGIILMHCTSVTGAEGRTWYTAGQLVSDGANISLPGRLSAITLLYSPDKSRTILPVDQRVFT